jgi:hypothetical protein
MRHHVLNRKGRTLSIELRDFGKLMQMKDNISKPGYLKQRMKFNPEALKELNHFHVKNTYENEALKKCRGYLLFAADGSKVAVPTSQETFDEYGGHVCKGGDNYAAVAGIACLYDVMNNIIISCDVTRGNHDEMKFAYDQLKESESIVGTVKTILILDRGYPSLPYFLEMIDNDQKFVVRLSSADYPKEQESMTSDDQITEIKITYSRLYRYKGSDCERRLREAGSISMRLVKIHFENGNTECLATNLAEKEFDKDSIGEIYSQRWGIETVYDMLKNNLELGNFTGTKPILIEQDIHACVYLCNVAQDMVATAQEKYERSGIGKAYKHSMSVNKAYCVGIMKDELLKAVLESDPDRKKELFINMITEIQENLVPVRPGRHYARKTHNKNSKYSNIHKRSY